MIIDCFPFLNELDLLEVRLNELKDVVDVVGPPVVLVVVVPVGPVRVEILGSLVEAVVGSVEFARDGEVSTPTPVRVEDRCSYFSKRVVCVACVSVHVASVVS